MAQMDDFDLKDTDSADVYRAILLSLAESQPGFRSSLPLLRQ